jgi:hypothetical protein
MGPAIGYLERPYEPRGVEIRTVFIFSCRIRATRLQARPTGHKHLSTSDQVVVQTQNYHKRSIHFVRHAAVSPSIVDSVACMLHRSRQEDGRRHPKKAQALMHLWPLLRRGDEVAISL